MNYRWLAVGILVLVLVGTVSAAENISFAVYDSAPYRGGVSEDFATIKAGAGTGIYNTGTTGYTYLYSTATGEGTFQSLIRYYITFNITEEATGITTDSTINYVNISLYPVSKTMLLGKPTVTITNASPVNPFSHVATDFNTLGTILMSSNNLTYDDAGTEYATFSLNAAGIQFVEDNIGSETTFAAVLTWDLDGAFSGVYVNGSKTSSLIFYQLEQTNTDKDPFITIGYDLPGGEDTTPPESISGLGNGTVTSNTILWNWTLPDPVGDLEKIVVWKDGVLFANYTNSTTYVQWTGLDLDTEYTFSARTEDWTGNLNETWVNASATTNGHDAGESGTLTVYAPTDGDGCVIYTSSGSSYAVIHDGAGSGIDLTTASGYAHVRSLTGTGTFYDMKRGVFVFPTGILDDSATINSATFQLGLVSAAAALGTPGYGLTPFTPDNEGIIVAGDYNSLNNTRVADDIPYASLATNGSYNTWTITDLSVINRTGNTSLMVRDEWDIDYVDTFGGSSDEIGSTEIRFDTNESGIPPRLVIGFTNPPVAPTANFTADDTSGKAPHTVQFTDTSEHLPTSWVWTYNSTGTWVEFNTTSATPVFEFPAGVYDINLTVSNSEGSDSEIKEGYIHSVEGYPTADFTGNPVSGLHPLEVTFADASDVTDGTYLWTFGDGNTTDNTLQNPVHMYWDAGTYTVSLNVTNATGSDILTRTAYISATNPPLDHPILIDVKQSPGYLNRSNAPFSTYEAQIASQASLGRSTDFFTPDYSITARFNRPYFSKYMGIEFQIGGNTDNVNKTSDALLTAQNNTDFVCIYIAEYVVAYDMIYPASGWENTTFTEENHTQIRNQLTQSLADCYYLQNSSSTTAISLVDNHASSYFGIGLGGLVFSDYVNSSLNSTPADWEVLGGDGLWVNDPLHTYTVGNHGLMAEGFNFVTGASRIGTYKAYFDQGLVDLINYWSNVKGTNYFDSYPTARTVAMIETWQVLPMNIIPNVATDGNLKRTTSKAVYNLLDVTNQSILKRSLDLMDTSTSHYGNDYYYSAPSPLENYLFVGDYYFSALSETPSSLNTLVKEGEFNIFREDWTNQSEWLSFTLYNTTTSSWRWQAHQDQLSFEYASHGDLLMPDTGEVKLLTNGSWNVYGWHQSQHNTILFENTTTSFGLTVGGTHYGNVSYRGIAKGAPHNAITNVLIDNTNVAYIDGTVTGVQREDDGAIPGSVPLLPATNVTRSILYPFKDYMVVIDRAESSGTHYFVNSFRFGSLNITPSPSTSLGVADDLSNIGHVNGALAINGVDYNWNNQTIALEIETGITANSIEWNTTSPYGDGVRLELFTAPASPINFDRYLTRISGYKVAEEIANPQIFTRPPENTTMFRVTSLLTTYQNETARTASELAVTGTGSAQKIISADTVNTDRIYTGLGNSTFDGFDTDADTVFIRTNETDTYALIVNGSYLAYGETDLIANASVQDYIEFQGDPLEEGDTSPVANFSAEPPTSGNAPLEVYFMDGSATDILTYNWSFGDGGYNETANPTYIYNTFGTYTVNLTVTNASGSAYHLEEDYITVYNTTPVADFLANVTSGEVPQVVQFTDNSTGTIHNWSWELDGVEFATTRNATYEFTVAGIYEWLNLTVTNDGGNDTISWQDSFTFTNSSEVTPVAHFLMYTVSPTPTPIVTPTPTPTPEGIPSYGAPTSLNGYEVGGAYETTVGSTTFGGGTPEHVYTNATSTYNVDNRTELLNALAAASSGNVIYVEEWADIDMLTSSSVTIPEGVILASNRGQGGSQGGRIFTTTLGSYSLSTMILFKTGGDDVHITGLRLQGECYPENMGGVGYTGTVYAEEGEYRIGLWIDGHSDIEIDNCELQGFAYADIYVDGAQSPGTWIHHNYIHNSTNANEGYGINVGDYSGRGYGDALIEGNVFDKNRHSVTGDGAINERYTLRYNLFLGSDTYIVGQSNVDMHGRGSSETYSGVEYDVYQNTLQGGNALFVRQRGLPSTGTYIYNNDLAGDYSYTGYSAICMQDGYPYIGNVNATNNLYEDVSYPGNDGIVEFRSN